MARDRETLRPISRAPLLLSLAVALLLSPAGASPAQEEEGCELLLQRASMLFDQGLFDGAEEAIGQCLQESPNRAEKRQAFALLAKIHLANDDLEAAEAALTRLLDTDPEFEPALFDSPRFARMVAKAKSRKVIPVVTSVSKSKESLLEAPATVVVITAEEIVRRGYLDLEAVLHDLPGFDFSRRAGASYANIYQRGYRSIETNRTLLLIDGVEDNDLAPSTAFISRQFPLSNIDRIEVIYGPASTMYGANAFAGVINVITKEPEAVCNGKPLGYDAWLTGGSWSTGSIDATLAGQSGSSGFRWMLSARKYVSDDYDHLSEYDDWDYDPAYYATVDYQGLSRLNPNDPATVQALLAQYTPEQLSAYFDIVRNPAGEAIALQLNAAGAARAGELDQTAYAQEVNGKPVRYSNPVDDWLVNGKIKTDNMVMGFQMWRRMEGGYAPLIDRFAAAGDNGFLWTPEHTALYIKYFKRFMEDKLSLTMFSRYKRHELDGNDSAFVFLRNYEIGALGPGDLMEGREPFWATTYYTRSNNQLRSEINLFYDHSERFNIIGGMELRFSSIGAQNIGSTSRFPGETGSVSSTIPGGNQISSRDVGAYVQASYRPIKPLKLVAGARLDNNSIRDTGGYGSVFNPRLAVVYRWQDLIFKAVYSEAFQDAPNFQKFEILPGVRELANPNLAPEEVSNIELSVGWSPSPELSIQLAAYDASYEGIVQEVAGIPCDSCSTPTTAQFQNVGRLDIQGLQAEARWTPGRYSLLANYTYCDPFNPDLGVRVGDIASHRINLLASASWWDRLEADLRLNWVSGRRTGQGTTVDRNPYSKIDDYLVAHTAVSWRHILPGFDLQLAINNLFDTEYFDPSIRNPSGFPIAPRIPQPGRTYFLRLRIAR